MAHIRRAKESDIPSIKRLIKSTKEMDANDSTYPVSYFQRLIGSGIVLVTEIDGKVVACCFGTMSKHEKWSDLLGLVVDRAHQHKGIGRTLLAMFEEHIKRQGISTIDLYSDVNSYNFYKENGYQPGRAFISFRKLISPKF
jgi:N-acetylglutamate synthase-like GNAT family acetyltransferase